MVCGHCGVNVGTATDSLPVLDILDIPNNSSPSHRETNNWEAEDVYDILGITENYVGVIQSTEYVHVYIYYHVKLPSVPGELCPVMHSFG